MSKFTLSPGMTRQVKIKTSEYQEYGRSFIFYFPTGIYAETPVDDVVRAMNEKYAEVIKPKQFKRAPGKHFPLGPILRFNRYFEGSKNPFSISVIFNRELLEEKPRLVMDIGAELQRMITEIELNHGSNY